CAREESSWEYYFDYW
nr:immunoglobulin heavy chain junction region [Macaca mulatta]MPN72552.1 immunoglobulin heavy chain junction region [Macaca mulatta]MPN73995.1 immunoglobulin heavy chain junction region [Macaca mulatta]MPN74550.1 immunoglobulin heavy chain junction region [Macaca mulatta]MPN76438.1 immunoglobulin heavy chain junction region [Macaca mulatta]